jgi:hypothetical protein
MCAYISQVRVTADCSWPSSLTNRGNSRPEIVRRRSIAWRRKKQIPIAVATKVRILSRSNLTWIRVIAILCQVGSLALVGMVLASCGGGGTPPIGVGPRELIGVTVQPGSGQAVAPNGTVTFSATGIFNLAPATQPSLPVQWASSDSNIATIDPTSGVATCLLVGGPITVTASVAGKGGMLHGSGTMTCLVSTPLSMPGSWIFFFTSAVSHNCLALETNLSEVGNHVFADSASALIFQPKPCTSTLEIELESLGGKCDSGSVGDVTVDATLSTGAVSLNLSETGASGSVVTTVSASNNGGSSINGTYSTPAACGFPEDHGSVLGYHDPFAFSGETYSGTLTFNGSPHAIVAHFNSTPNTFDLTMSGTDKGSSFVLNGSTVGTSLRLTGAIGGEPVNWFGLYDTTYNNFFLYNSDSTNVGALSNTP